MLFLYLSLIPFLFFCNNFMNAKITANIMTIESFEIFFFTFVTNCFYLVQIAFRCFFFCSTCLYTLSPVSLPVTSTGIHPICSSKFLSMRVPHNLSPVLFQESPLICGSYILLHIWPEFLLLNKKTSRWCKLGTKPSFSLR